MLSFEQLLPRAHKREIDIVYDCDPFLQTFLYRTLLHPHDQIVVTVTLFLQEAIAENSLPILHRLEQISSAEHIGTLAENVMEELKKNDQVAVQVLIKFEISGVRFLKY